MYLKHILFKSLFIFAFATFPIPPSVANDAIFTEPVTFEQAFGLALERSPQSQLLEAQQEASEGILEQAGYKPNPTVGAEMENVLGTGDLKGLDGVEITVGISQLIERGDKRQRRSELARRSRELFTWDYKETVAELRYEVMQLFSRALVAQQNVELQQELLELAKESEAEVERRAEAARASTIEVSQAKLATSQQEFQLRSSQRQLTEAKIPLSALWNMPNIEAFKLAGNLELDPTLPDLEVLQGLIDEVPTIARYQTEREVQEAAVELEKAQSKADYELFGGARYVREGGGDAAFVLGIEIPWQIRNKNQGNIRSAMAGLRVVDSQKRIAHRNALAELSIAYGELGSSLDEWKNLKVDLLPSAEEALRETEAGYEQGIILYLNVLEARRALFEIRTAMLESTQRYLSAQAKIESLTRSAQTYTPPTP
ncbi:MAG: TolC family protein [Verrucomicrobiae bacterium]|nr:TolC family protein [Verrucomicrobiae bacterium]